MLTVAIILGGFVVAALAVRAVMRIGLAGRKAVVRGVLWSLAERKRRDADPYYANLQVVAGIVGIGIIVGAVALASWLSSNSDEPKQMTTPQKTWQEYKDDRNGGRGQIEWGERR